MSATLQIIAVMKTLGVITLKDHSLAPVSQGTKAMDTIVQVKFLGFFQVYLKQFSTIRLKLRGDFWHVLKSMRKRECVLTVTDNIWRILHGGAKIWTLVSSGKTIFYERAQWVKYCFCHEKIKFISSSRRVMFFLLYRQKGNKEKWPKLRHR